VKEAIDQMEPVRIQAVDPTIKTEGKSGQGPINMSSSQWNRDQRQNENPKKVFRIVDKRVRDNVAWIIENKLVTPTASVAN
jgi:hypothetical protein